LNGILLIETDQSEINIENLNNGVYITQIISESKNEIRKLLVVKN